MATPAPVPDDRLTALLGRFQARAAGCWRIVGDRLERVAFAAARDLPGDIARGFSEATQSVPLSATELGIVRAALSGGVAVSRAEELPPEAGSGLWLRRFGASRSVAVAVVDSAGAVAFVVSLALDDGAADDVLVAEAIREEFTDRPIA